MQLILGLALAAAVFVILKKWGALSPEGQKAAIWKAVLVVGGALLLFMVLTGRVHVLTAAVAAIIPLLRKLPALLKFAPWFAGRWVITKGQLRVERQVPEPMWQLRAR